MLIGVGNFCGLSSVSDNEIEAGRQAGGVLVEKAMSDFNSWACSRLAEKGDTEKNNKRKYVPMTQETYEGTATRVYNAKTMG